MKLIRILKSVALASALVAATTGHAASVTIGPPGSLSSSPFVLMPSDSTLALSNSADDPFSMTPLLEIIGAGLSAFGTAVTNIYEDQEFNNHIDVVAPLLSLSADSETGNIADVYSSGGLRITAVKSGPYTGTTNGGSLTIENIHADLANGVVYAHVVGSNACFDLPATATLTQKNAACGSTASSLTPAYSIDATIPMFTWTSVVGPTSLPQDPSSYDTGTPTTLSKLSATFEARAAMKGALSLKNLSLSMLNGTANFGSLTFNINLAAVPEPSGYALLGLGLAAAGGIARRRRSAC